MTRLRELEPEEQVWVVWDDDAKKYVDSLPPAKGPRLGILHDYRRHRECGGAIIGGYRR